MQDNFRYVPLGAIFPDPNQPRRDFDEDSINELADSIKSKGLLQPVLLRPTGENGALMIICGERRCKAAYIAGLEEIPAIIREMSDEEAFEVQIIENLQRKDVHPMEEAVAFKSLLKKDKTIAEIAARVGKNERYIRQRLKLTSLTKEWQKVFYHGRIRIIDAITIASFDTESQKELWQSEGDDNVDGEIFFDSWTFNNYRSNLANASFPLDMADIDKKAGTCTNCQFNTSVASLFPEAEKDMRCTKTSCFKNKSEKYFDICLNAMHEDPEIILVSDTWRLLTKEEKVKLETETHKIIEVRHSNHITIVGEPKRPDLSDYDKYDSVKEMRADYEQDLKEYESNKKDFDRRVESGKLKKAFVVHGDDKGLFVYLDIKKQGSKTAGGISTDMGGEDAISIEDEIKRIQDREKRAKELDAEKVQQRIVAALKESPLVNDVKEIITKPIDRIIMLSFLNDKIDYSHHDEINKHIYLSGVFSEVNDKKVLERIISLTDNQATFLARKVALMQYGTSVPNHTHGLLLRKLAEEIGIPVDAFESEQREAAEKRVAKVDNRIKALRAQLKKETKKA